MENPRESERVDSLANEDQLQEELDRAAEVARRAHLDPRPDHVAGDPEDAPPGEGGDA